MGDNKNDFMYDEDDSVAYIQNYLPQEMKNRFSKDDINYIVDVMYDFYDSKDSLDKNVTPSDNDEIEIDEDELITYVIKNAKKDGVGEYTSEEITFIVQGELEYCESIHLFD